MQTLERFGLFRDGVNPVARTNVCPHTGKPSEPSIYAFCYTVPTETPTTSFVVSGGAEAAEGKGDYYDSIIALGDTSIEGLRDKLRYVRDEQARRIDALGRSWHDALDVRLLHVARRRTATSGRASASRHRGSRDQVVRRESAGAAL